MGRVDRCLAILVLILLFRCSASSVGFPTLQRAMEKD